LFDPHRQSNKAPLPAIGGSQNIRNGAAMNRLLVLTCVLLVTTFAVTPNALAWPDAVVAPVEVYSTAYAPYWTYYRSTAPVVYEAPVTTTYYAPTTTTYYAPSTTTYYAPSTTTYYAPAPTTYYSTSVPTTTYYAPVATPVTTYYAPAPTVTYYTPSVSYYTPSVSYYTPVTTYYSTPVYSTYYAPALYYVPRRAWWRW
jgi:hypothetical protein